MKKILAALLVASLFASAPLTVSAAQCRDTKGKFIKCPPAPAPAAKKPVKCRDSKGKFIKCPA